MSNWEDVLLLSQWLLFIAETLSQYWKEHYFFSSSFTSETIESKQDNWPKPIYIV